MADETPKNLHTLTLRELNTTLEHRGFDLSYKTLSNLLNTDDISEQLGITGERNARHIPANVVDILVEFLPQYKENKGTLPQAATMLKNYLQLVNRSESNGTKMVEQKSSTGTLLPVERFASTRELTVPMLAEAFVQAVQRTVALPPPDDALLPIKTAAEVYGVSLGTLKKISLKEGGKRKVRRSDVLRMIEGLGK